jgi:hypothetical protein
MKSRKSQANQIFIWALAAIMMTLLLIFGYRAINTITNRGEQVQYLGFQNELRSIMESTMDYGAERRASFRPPAGFKEVCFVKTYGGLPSVNAVPEDYPLIRDNINSQISTSNVYLVKEVSEESFSIGDIDVDGGFLCVEVNRGEIKLRIEGFGKYARIYSD